MTEKPTTKAEDFLSTRTVDLSRLLDTGILASFAALHDSLDHDNPAPQQLRDILLRDELNRVKFIEAYFQAENAQIARMRTAWPSHAGEPVLYYTKAGHLIGLGLNCELGEVPRILIHAQDLPKE